MALITTGLFGSARQTNQRALGQKVSKLQNLRLENAIRREEEGGGFFGSRSLIGGAGGAAVNTPSFRFQNGTLTRTEDNPLYFGRQIKSRYGDLFSSVRLGFGRWPDTVRRSIRDRSAVAVGNLRESLGRRRVLGASFAGDALGRVKLGFAREEAQELAKVGVQEVQLQNQILRDQSGALTTQIQGELQEFNIAADFSTSLNELEIKRLELEQEFNEMGGLLDLRVLV